MSLMEAMKARHSVRRYQQEPIAAEVLSSLRAEIAALNEKNGLDIQLVTNEPKAFSGWMAKYGKFSGVSNYFAMIGKKEENTEEIIGYCGERLVLRAQQLGLNTCWVGLTYSKVRDAYVVKPREKLYLLICVGVGATQGVAHKIKSPEEVMQAPTPAPEWFMRGIEAALLAPTAVNQQKFMFTLEAENRVVASAGRGPYTKVDLGIAKYHFEIGAGSENFVWA